MAKRVSKIYGGDPVVNAFEIDENFKDLLDIRIKDFGTQTTEEWAKFVMNNRNRAFTDEQDALCNKDKSSQYSFHTEKAVRLLRKVDDLNG